MSINPVSDIVMDVARAADPVKSRAAAERLSRGVATDGTSSHFDQSMTDAATAPQASHNSFAGGGAKAIEMLPRTDARTKAYKGLEQLVLKGLVEAMLPKETGVVFGTGTAGDIWRSFLADQLAMEVGKTVDLGITRPEPGSNRVQAVTHRDFSFS